MIQINLLAFSGNNAINEVKIGDRFSESIHEFESINWLVI